MAITDVFKRAQVGEMRLSRGRVVAIEPDGRARVRISTERGQDIACDVLRLGAERATPFEPGTEVLVACADEPGGSGVILGTVGPAGATADPPIAGSVLPGQPLKLEGRDIVVEAGERLTLKCGEASIAITRDGKIVIRGEHILSRAKGTQRIKGGSVAIN